MFVNTRKEAKVVAKMANYYGWDVGEKYFYKRDVAIAMSPWSNEEAARNFVRHANGVLRNMRVK